MDAPNSRRATGPWCGGQWKRVGFPSCASWGAANAPGRWRLPPPQPPRNLCPTAHKGAPSNGGTTIMEKPPSQRQRWGRQSQSPHHPRLCVALPCPLIGGPRKRGSRGETAWRTRPKGRSSTCGSPRCLFGFFLGIQKEARRRKRRNTPDPAPQVPTTRLKVPEKILTAPDAPTRRFPP